MCETGMPLYQVLLGLRYVYVQWWLYGAIWYVMILHDWGYFSQNSTKCQVCLCRVYLSIVLDLSDHHENWHNCVCGMKAIFRRQLQEKCSTYEDTWGQHFFRILCHTWILIRSYNCHNSAYNIAFICIWKHHICSLCTNRAK